MQCTRRWLFAAGLVASVLGAARLATAQQINDPIDVPAFAAANSQSEAESMLRGPIHESFAQPIAVNPEPGMIAPQPPPEPIHEMPPEVRPADENAVWIPGYWAWAPEREDFLWVSGVWRVPPPGRRWVAGYWTEAQDGYQWLSGFWAPLEDPQLAYLPAPPQSIEEGPTSPAPSAQYFWVSGSWIYQQGGYAWRPGYWAPFYEGWVWVPAHYVWTPRGCIFVDGYWDYPVVRRGQCFAPVYFSGPVYRQPSYVYTPRVAINLNYLLMHLFVNPRFNHYYCGNYYDNRYQQIGFYPWSTFARQPRYFDPLFAYYSTFFQTRGVNYAQRLDGWHQYYQQNERFRPPVTLREQTQLASRADANSFVRYSLLGQGVEQLLEGRDTQTRFERVAEEQRRQLSQSRSELRDVIEARRRVETQTASEGVKERPEGRAETRAPVTVRLPDTPELADRRARQKEDRRPDVRNGSEPRFPGGPPEARDRQPREDAATPPPRPDRGPARPEVRGPERRGPAQLPKEKPGGKSSERPGIPPDRAPTFPGRPSEERLPPLPSARDGAAPQIPQGRDRGDRERETRDPRVAPPSTRGRDERVTPQFPSPTDPRLNPPSPRGEERKAPAATPGGSVQPPAGGERPSTGGRKFPGGLPFDRGYRDRPEVERGRPPASRPSQGTPETQKRPELQPTIPSDPFRGRAPQLERPAPRIETPSAPRGRSFEPPGRSRGGGSERPNKPPKDDRDKGKEKGKGKK